MANADIGPGTPPTSDVGTATGGGDESRPSKPLCFVAYPSSPPDRAESIEQAINEFQDGGVIDIMGWKSLEVGGRVVISAICDEIKKRHVFIADVTVIIWPGVVAL